MSKSETVLIAIGGGEFAEAEDVLQEFLDLFRKKSDPRLTVMTVATSEPESAAAKYRRLFSRQGIKQVDIVDVSDRADAFEEESLEKIRKADGLFFTGGDQLIVTSLLGGSPLHNLIHERLRDGFVIAGTSAGAMMMSNSMIISGQNDTAPKVGGVEIAPGMDLLSSTIIDTHFSQRGRHGRLLTAVAHYPQDLGIGIDERTAIVARHGEIKVVGEGTVTIIDGSEMKHSNLPYRRDDEMLGLFNACIHVLPAGYKYNLKKREPISPTFGKLAVTVNEV
jgi:cyanophycinase